MGLPSGRRLNRVYSAFFGCEVRFETDCCAVLFDPELVDRKLERGDVTSHALCAEQRQRLLDKLDEGDNLVERVRQLIAGDITNMSALKSVADRLWS